MIVSAPARIRAPERKFVYSGSFDEVRPSARGNWVGNRNRLYSEAPRQA